MTGHALPASWLIVGSGFYPWLVALFLQKKLIRPIKHAGLGVPRLSLVELPSTSPGPLITTTSALRHFNKSVGLSEAEFVRECQACFNLGTLVQRKTEPEKSTTSLFVTEGPYGFTINGQRFQHLFARYLQQGTQGSFDNFSIAAQLAKKNRFTPPSPNAESIFSTVKYGYRFLAHNYRDYLEKILESDITVYRSQIKQVKLDSEKQRIDSLQLDNGNEVQGDFFIDLSKRRLLKTSIDGPIKDGPIKPDSQYSNVLKSTQLTPRQDNAGLNPYQELKLSAGEFTIESSTRYKRQSLHLRGTANGDNAFEFFFDPEPWQSNCLALGPAANNRVALIVDEIHSLLKALNQFAAFWPRQAASDANTMSQTWFNRNVTAEYAKLRDIDSLFFNSSFAHLGAKLSEGAKEKVSMFTETGQLPAMEHKSLNESQWIAIMLALGFPTRADNILVKQVDSTEIVNQLEQIQQSIKQAANSAPLHEDFLRKSGLIKDSN